MAVPTIYAKLVEHYDERMSNSSNMTDYVKTTCTDKIRYVRHLSLSVDPEL